MDIRFKKFELLFVPSKENDYRPGFLQSKILLYFVILLFIAKVAVIGVSVGLPKNMFFADITKIALTNFVNQGRIDSGLQPLIENRELDFAAELKARDMMQKGYFSHQSPEGVTPWFWFKQAGYNYKEIGTAVLNGFGANKTIIIVQFFGNAEPVKATINSVKTPGKKMGQLDAAKGKEQIILGTTQNKNNQFVLSQSTETADKNNSYYKILNFVTYNFEEIIQNIIYVFIIIIGSALLSNIFINFNIQRKDLIMRALIITVILLSASAINKDIVIGIIPHQIII